MLTTVTTDTEWCRSVFATFRNFDQVAFWGVKSGFLGLKNCQTGGEKWLFAGLFVAYVARATFLCNIFAGELFSLLK
jgi:hypothetical protein